MTGFGWNCTLATLTCKRPDALNAWAGYPPITHGECGWLRCCERDQYGDGFGRGRQQLVEQLGTITDTLPAGLRAAAPTGPSGWICMVQTLSCTIMNVIAANGTAQFTLTVNVASNAGASVMNAASVSGGAIRVF